MEEDRSLISTSVGTNCRRFLGDSYTASRSSLLFALRTAPRRRTANTMCGQSESTNPGSRWACLPINTITLMGKTDGPYHYHQRSKDSQARNTKLPVFITSVKEYKKKFKLLKPSYFLPLGWGGALNFLAPLIVHPKKKKNQSFLL